MTKHVTQSFVEKSNNFRELEIVNLEATSSKWRLPFSVLKRIDVLQTAWSSSKEIPIKDFLDYPIFSDQGVTVNDWLWQERSKYLPSIEVPFYPIISRGNITHDKLKLTSNHLLDRLKQLTDILDAGRFPPPLFFLRISFVPLSMSDKQRSSEQLSRPRLSPLDSIPIPFPSNVYTLTAFLPQKHLNHLKPIQKAKPKVKDTCELDYMRFKF